MNEMIERGLVAFEADFYSPVIHNPKAIANYMYLDGKFCDSAWKKETESAIIILLEMKLGWN